MIDICTVVFDAELPTLKLQAKSIEQYCSGIGIQTIYVVVNSESLTDRIDTAWWGKLAKHVRIVPRNTFSTDWVDNGWVSQQVLKLLAASLSFNTWTIVLDTKTIFVRELTRNNIFDDHQRPRVGKLDIYPVFDASRKIVEELFDISLIEQLGPGGVPFFLHNQTVRNMINDIELGQRVSFPNWFQDHGRLTEFILYSGYVISQDGTFNRLYNTTENNITPCNICHSEVSSFERKLNEMPSALTVSIHRNAWQQLTAEQQQQYTDFLQSRGIS